jgi:hypothetical protein
MNMGMESLNLRRQFVFSKGISWVRFGVDKFECKSWVFEMENLNLRRHLLLTLEFERTYIIVQPK